MGIPTTLFFRLFHPEPNSWHHAFLALAELVTLLACGIAAIHRVRDVGYGDNQIKICVRESKQDKGNTQQGVQPDGPASGGSAG